MASNRSLVRPLVQGLHGYVPGEQPKIRGLIKLNTNENPYPPSPKVLAATKAAVDGRFRLYPNPTSQPLREALAKLHGCSPSQVFIGNGSDELLALALRAFVEPETGSKSIDAATVQYFDPSYSLYPVLAAIHGARCHPVPLGAGFSIPAIPKKRGSSPTAWNPDAALSFVTTPNAPSGTGYRTSDLETLCKATRGVVVLDEAYVDFAAENALDLALRLPNVLVFRTFSKAYSLCFQRVGYCIGPAELIDALDRIRDSYNVNGLGQVAALATLKDLPYYRKNFRRIIATRERLTAALTELGFIVVPSQTNFILAKPPGPPAEQWLQQLREHRILVRWFRNSAIADHLRITIGSEAEAEQLLRVVRRLVPKPSRR
jgi:histidinol-phosphate aminotransferase